MYNTEKYIEKSMDSIMKAIDKDCEVIFVNDGSTDKSKEKIMEFMEKLPEEYKENFRYTEKGIKDCTNCTLPHRRDNYDYIIGKFKDIINITKKDD